MRIYPKNLLFQLQKPNSACFAKNRTKNYRWKRPQNATDLGQLLTDYAICAAAEGKSRSSIAIVTSSVRYFSDFLRDNGASTDALDVSATHLRICSLYLTQKPCFSGHRLTPAQPRGFSGHTINTYMWSTRGFFSWLMVEDILDENPFDRVKVPRCPRRVIPTFSESQIAQLLAAIDTTTSTGCRDCTMILVMLDCGLRVSELWWG